MEQFKRAQVIMLPTNVLSNISLSKKTNNLVCNSNKHDTLSMFTNHHLYIISDNEIKKGDWCLDTVHNILFISDGNLELYKSTDKKIIATTDTSLKKVVGIGTFAAFPQPSQQFIEKYIESYNKGEVIANVLIEYKNYTKGNLYGNPMMIKPEILNRLKINPKDNTITIKKLKDSWNREEVINLIKASIYAQNYDIYVTKYPDNTINKIDDKSLNKWIEKNL
jgi:hypothetical protein